MCLFGTLCGCFMLVRNRRNVCGREIVMIIWNRLRLDASGAALLACAGRWMLCRATAAVVRAVHLRASAKTVSKGRRTRARENALACCPAGRERRGCRSTWCTTLFDSTSDLINHLNEVQKPRKVLPTHAARWLNENPQCQALISTWSFPDVGAFYSYTYPRMMSPIRGITRQQGRKMA